MSTTQEKALGILAGMLDPAMSRSISSADTTQQFAGGIGQLAFSNVFEKLWTRDGFDLRTRSLLTLAILIALRADDEMEVHFPAAIRNGASLADLEELIYHATGYAGFPAANSARTIAIAALKKAGMIEQ